MKLKEYSRNTRNTLTVTFTQTFFCASLALVRELLAMIVDPRRGSNEPGQETNHSTQTAGNGPNLQEARQVSLTVPSHKVS